MIKTLYSKLVAVLLGFTVIMAVMFLVAIRQSDQARNQEISQNFYGNLASRILGGDVLAPDGTVNAATVRRVAERIQIINPRIDVYLLDAAGSIIAASGSDAIKRDIVNLEPVRRFLAGDAKLPIFGDDPSDARRERVFSAAGVRLQDGAQGYLYLVIRGRSGDSLVQRVKNSYVLSEVLLLIACGLLVALAASAFIVKLITRPLRRLAIVVDKFRRSGFAEHPETARIRSAGADDEIGQLSDAFNRMADRMLEQMQAMKTTDATRRELVANISHDLRTPLASLQGYLETLQFKQASLSQAEKEAYLQIALRHTEQLGELVTKLFELAKLDSDQVTLFPEPFALEELALDVIQQFDLAAQQKGVRLETRLPAELPLVSADIGLIERVLRNLIENALRHTEAGGSIGIAVEAGADRCRIDVWDGGAGIEPADLPRIFDRFYRGEKSRGAAAAHAGLGLAIVKRILDLHESVIDVSSRPGRTVFSFTLRYASRPHPQPGGAPEAAGAAPARSDRARAIAGAHLPAPTSAAGRT